MFGKPMTRLLKGSMCVALALVGACLVLRQPAIAAGASQSERLSVEARLQRAEDEKQIHDLLIRYGRMLDTRDLAGYAQLFAKNGEWTGLLGGKLVTVKGPDAILAKMRNAFAGSPYDPNNVTSFHLITNIMISVDGDRAIAYSRWTVMAKGKDRIPSVRMGGHYDDVLIREDGGWKFLSRSAPRDIPAPDE